MSGAAHRIARLPVLVVLPHNRCNCRCAMCDIWRIREKQEIGAYDVARQLDSIRALGVEWIVFSGGEPQLHSDLKSIAGPLREAGIRLTLLTAGLLLHARAEETAELFDDVIVSLDGPPHVHDAIRGVPRAFARLAAGVERLRSLRPSMPISARCTVQRQNHATLRAAASTAKAIELDSISFLAADTASTAFNREPGPSLLQVQAVALNHGEVETLAAEVELLISDYADEINRRFIAESAAKLHRIVDHFRAGLGQVAPAAPRCNAPWVSAVIESDGSVRPCFFHDKIGNIRDGSLVDLLNSEAAVAFRSNLDIATNPVCRRCVCSLHVPAETQNEKAAHAG